MAKSQTRSCSLVPWRFLTSRSRPLAFLLVFVVTWFLLTVLYLHQSPSRAPDSAGLLSKKYLDGGLASIFQAAEARLASLNNTDAGLKSPVPEESSAAKEARFEAEEREFSKRRERYEKLCKTHVTGSVGIVYYYNNLSYCHVQKAGCTFWKRAFHFMYNETGGKPVKSLYDIDRFYVHFGGEGKVKAAGYASKKSTIDNTTKVLFTRDPYFRLWSSYVDKFVLPDSWLDHGRAIVRRRKKRRKSCPDDIEFVEFLDYAVKANRDSHWTPVHTLCNPCVFRPQYVGKVETFARDSTHILQKVGLGRLVEGRNDHSHYVEDEMRMLTKYTFRLYETRPGLRSCLTHSGVAERLWKAFVLNGYIAESLTFPQKDVSAELDSVKTPVASERAVTILLKAHGAGPVLSSSEMKAHRRRVMAEHYKAAPPELLARLVDLFNLDFTLFDYDPRPADIFS